MRKGTFLAEIPQRRVLEESLTWFAFFKSSCPLTGRGLEPSRRTSLRRRDDHRDGLPGSTAAAVARHRPVGVFEAAAPIGRSRRRRRRQRQRRRRPQLRRLPRRNQD